MGSACRATAQRCNRAPARERPWLRASRARSDHNRLEAQIPPRQSGKAMASVRDRAGACKKKAPVRRFWRFANRGVLAGRGGKGGWGLRPTANERGCNGGVPRFLKNFFVA